MSLIEIPVGNLLGGVSQQPAANRVSGQVEACDNALLHVVNGCTKRKGSRHIAKLIDGFESILGHHFINRDTAERYLVLMGERRLRVFDADDGTEYPVKVNGTSTNAGRGLAGSGTPLLYLDPRVSGGVVDQDEDFVIGAGDWLSVAANSATSYVTGRGPFGFGRRQSTSSVTADTVALVGNGAVASISDIYQDYGEFASFNAFAVYAKKNAADINDVELSFENGADVYSVRFDIDDDGVFTAASKNTDGVVDSSGPFPTGSGYVTADVEDAGDGWYRIAIRLKDEFEDAVLPIVGSTRRIKIRFHTNAATPASKNLLLFGARCYSGVRDSQALPAYVFERPDLFRALTIADTTFLLNTEVVTAMEAADTADNPLACYVWVKIGAITDVDYTVKVYYTTATVPGDATFTYNVASTSTGIPTAGTGQTDSDIAEGLRALIDADANLVATRVGSVIRIDHTSLTAGNAIRGVEVSDSRGDSTMEAFSLDVDGFLFTKDFTNLPLLWTDGEVVLVRGREDTGDDYWVKFNGVETGFVAGYWEESLRPGVRDTRPGVLTTIDADTMPFVLTRLQDDATGTVTGTPLAIYFDVSAADWEDRLVGDDDSNPEPAFIGHPIQDLFLYRGRLGFLADDDVILSEAGEVFNFWRTTVLELLDSDTISVNAGAKDAVEFRNAATTANSLLLFSDRHQYQLLGDPTLTPSSAQLTPVRSFENLTSVPPADTGRGVIFARADRAFSGLMEASLLQDDTTFRIEDLFVSVPRYAAGNALEIDHSSLTGLTVMRPAEPTHLFLHQSFRDDQENRLQSAVHRWTFAPDTLIRGAGFLDAELRLLVERAEGWFLETVLTDAQLLEGGRPITYLDRRLDETQVTAVYAGGTDTTTITLPYEVDADATMVVVDAESGLIVPITDSPTSTTIEVHGDLSGSALFVGEAFELRVTLTEPVVQTPNPRGGVIPLTGRPLDVHRLYLYVSDTAFIAVEVAPDLRTATVEEFSAAGLGTGLLLEGELVTYTGDADFAILGQSTELAVTITNDSPFPSNVQSARWEVLTTQRTRLV